MTRAPPALARVVWNDLDASRAPSFQPASATQRSAFGCEPRRPTR